MRVRTKDLKRGDIVKHHGRQHTVLFNEPIEGSNNHSVSLSPFLCTGGHGFATWEVIGHETLPETN